jgi:DNA polymerase III subunit delta'
VWNRIIGQERVKRILRQAIISGRLPHAYLFTGAEGIGKDAAAIELAKVLNCEQPLSEGTEACDVCSSCKNIATFRSPLIKLVFPLAKTDTWSQKDMDEEVELSREQLALKAEDPYYNIVIPKALEIKLDQIRNIRLEASRSVQPGKKRVVIISEADTMRNEAQNALLKTLEEPQASVLFILTSSNPARLFTTIQSRCQDIRFDLLGVEEIQKSLVEQNEVDATQAEFLARLSGGSLTVARSMANEDMLDLRKKVVQFLRVGLSRSRKNLIAELDSLIPRRGSEFMERRQTVEQLLRLFYVWFRDALALASNNKESIINTDLMEDLMKFTTRFGDPARLVKALHIVQRAANDTRLQLQLREVLIAMSIELEETLLLKAA